MRTSDPRQLQLFEESKLGQRGTYGQSLFQLAGWALEHGTARLTGRERSFLYGILTSQCPISMDDAAEIHRLHQRVGKQQLRQR